MSLKRASSDKSGEILSEKLLFEAAAAGDEDLTADLLQTGISVDAEDFNKALFYASKNYMTPLQIAAANGFFKCVEILIRYGADVNAKDRFDVSATHMAAEKGNYLCLKALLDAGADCSLPTKYSKMGSYTAVPHLGGTTPLHLAALHNHVECVKELIQYGADYNAVDERGRTSLYIAAQFGYEECVLAHLKNAVGRDILSLPSFETFDTPLHFAVSRGMIESVRELICLGSDVNHRNYSGATPLHLAVTSFYDNHDVCFDILQMLVLKGYNVDVNEVDGAHFTPLHYVCFKGRSLVTRRPDMAEFLIQYGADINIRSARGASLLECELKSTDEDLSILKCMVKSMLHLPQLKDIKVSYPALPSFEEVARAQNAMLLSRNANVPAHNPNAGNLPDVSDDDNMDVNLPEIRFYSVDTVLNIDSQAPARPPVYYVGDHRSAELSRSHAVNENRLSRLTFPEIYLEVNAKYEASLLHRKCVWYENLACNPRTLQHCCRYIIRKTLGPRSLRNIWKLPIPPALQSYLLLKYGE